MLLFFTLGTYVINYWDDKTWIIDDKENAAKYWTNYVVKYEYKIMSQ